MLYVPHPIVPGIKKDELKTQPKGHQRPHQHWVLVEKASACVGSDVDLPLRWIIGLPCPLVLPPHAIGELRISDRIKKLNHGASPPEKMVKKLSLA